MRKASYTLFSFFVVSTFACADPASNEVDGLQIRSIAAASCEQHGNNNEAFPVGADSFVIKLSGDGLEQPFIERVEKDGDGPYVLTGIPPAENLTMDIVACSGSTAVAAGRSFGLDIVEHQKSFPPVFLTPIGGQTACVQLDDDKLKSSHAFGSILRTGDQVFALGGLGTYALEQSVGVAKATDSVSVYDRLTGNRTTAQLKLSSPRAMATTFVVGNTLRLIGGAKTVKLNTPNFDLWPSGGSSPTCSVEAVDLAAGTSECESDVAFPAGGAGVQVSDQAAVYAGGVEAGGDLGEGSSKLFIIEPGSVSELAMPQARVGASIVGLSSNKALVWGGNFDADLSASALLVDAANKTVISPSVTGDQVPVTMWSSAVYAGQGANGEDLVLVAGGTEIKMNNGAVSAPIPPSAARLYLLTVTTESVNVKNVSMTNEESVRFKRVAATLMDVGEGQFWFFGGVTSYSNDADVCPNQSGGGCFPEQMSRFSIGGTEPTLQLAAETLTAMSVGPLGAIAVDLGDESSLIVGGLRSAGVDALDKNAELVRYGSSAGDLCASSGN